MFGISFTELVLILVVALVVLGPQRLPGMLRTVGMWIHKVRRMTTEVRAQTGIDDLLRQEGIGGGLAEFRSMLRGDPGVWMRSHLTHDGAPTASDDPYHLEPLLDASRERPVEGPDAYGALPDDLVDESVLLGAPTASAPVESVNKDGLGGSSEPSPPSEVSPAVSADATSDGDVTSGVQA